MHLAQKYENYHVQFFGKPCQKHIYIFVKKFIMLNFGETLLQSIGVFELWQLNG